jgi:flagellar hook-basal body complex protein FliE
MANVINSYSTIMDRYSSMISQAAAPAAGSAGDQESVNAAAGSFGELLSAQIDKLNSQQVSADNLIADFTAGNTDDLHQVMIAAEEASLSMEMAVQVRNKIIDAYKELNNMQL